MRKKIYKLVVIKKNESNYILKVQISNDVSWLVNPHRKQEGIPSSYILNWTSSLQASSDDSSLLPQNRHAGNADNVFFWC